MLCVLSISTTMNNKKGHANIQVKKQLMKKKLICAINLGLWSLLWSVGVHAGSCENASPGTTQLYWGDLHVHTAYSLDAYVFGAIATPKEAFAFAKGQPLRLANGETAALDRPLDFTAVTDHAETYDVMYVCTDPQYRDDAYCRAIRGGREPGNARSAFNDYLIPLVSDVPPQAAPLCAEDGVDCRAASASQWLRTQYAANEANEPCNFTALIGYEWSASPGGRHWHRNVIFRSETVPEQVVDYIHFPQVTSLWRELALHCRPEDGCDALAIPHNINWANGGPTFDVENADAQALQARARYERVAEIHQEKGNSECLAESRPEPGDPANQDCGFEILNDNAALRSLAAKNKISKDEAWQRARPSYYRSLLARGLRAFEKSEGKLNPMMLGVVGSTDNHFGTPGNVSEADFFGGLASLNLTDEQRLSRPGYNPGGLVAVWAQENTRAGIFDALQSRSSYATSGPRIKLRFGATEDGGACKQDQVNYQTNMGQVLSTPSAPPTFTIEAGRDATPLAEVQIIKGELINDSMTERTITIAKFPDGQDAVCISWQDPQFNVDAPAYWYVRVLEMPSPRWTKLICERAGICEDFPEIDINIRERAWSSPIWHLPQSS